MVERNVRELVVAHLRRGAEQQVIALEDAQGTFAGEGADADFGAGEVLEDGDGRLVDDFQLPDHLDEIDEGRAVPVGEVEAEDAHARGNQFREDVAFVGGGADSRQNLGFHQGILWSFRESGGSPGWAVGKTGFSGAMVRAYRVFLRFCRAVKPFGVSIG